MQREPQPPVLSTMLLLLSCCSTSVGISDPILPSISTSVPAYISVHLLP
ncbi:hypothetical protein ACHAW6_014333 [Cyclotella cf. meneghiniana]